jgi:hypothetical protein
VGPWGRSTAKCKHFSWSLISLTLDKPFVDFNVQHRCKNYNAVRAWAEARQLPDPDTLPSDYLNGPTGRVLSEIP